MPQTIQLVRGSTALVNNTGTVGTTLFTVPSCIACRIITVQVNFICSVSNTQTYYSMLRHDPSGGYPSPLWYGQATNIYTGCLNLPTYDDASSFFIGNSSNVLQSGLAIGAGNGYTNFTQTSTNALTSVAPMPRNFWMGPSDELKAFNYGSNGGSGSVSYEFILVLYS